MVHGKCSGRLGGAGKACKTGYLAARYFVVLSAWPNAYSETGSLDGAMFSPKLDAYISKSGRADVTSIAEA